MTLWLYDFMHNHEYLDIRKWQMALNQLSYIPCIDVSDGHNPAIRVVNNIL